MHFDGWTLALQTINFAVLVWLLHRFLYKPVLGMIDVRQADIQKQCDDAKAVEDRANAYVAAMTLERAGIAAEREAVLTAAAAQAQAAAEARRAEAERDAQALVEATRKSLATEREHALAELRQSVLDLSIELARRLLAEVPVQLLDDAWLDRIEQHLSALPRAELDALARQFTDGRALTVVTAAPLPAETADIWRTRLRRPLDLADDITIAFEVDPSLVAGAELHFPSAILRFSWQSALATMRSGIEAHGDTH